MRTTHIEYCIRCNGKGFLDWTNQDDGICYKCQGLGYLGGQNDEHDAIINERNSSREWGRFVDTHSRTFRKFQRFLIKQIFNSDEPHYSLDMFILSDYYSKIHARNFKRDPRLTGLGNEITGSGITQQDDYLLDTDEMDPSWIVNNINSDFLDKFLGNNIWEIEVDVPSIQERWHWDYWNNEVVGVGGSCIRVVRHSKNSVKVTIEHWKIFNK